MKFPQSTPPSVRLVHTVRDQSRAVTQACGGVGDDVCLQLNNRFFSISLLMFQDMVPHM